MAELDPTVVVGDPSPLDMVPACPLCHTVATAVTTASLQAGVTWTCTTCGQKWSARRLQTVAAYARYTVAH